MDILVMGGTRFLGRFIVGSLMKKHNVTILNRGTKKGIFGRNVKEVYAERKDSYQLKRGLSNKKFDAVIDLTAYKPSDTKVMAEIFKNKSLRHFIHCSTIAVYSIENRMPLTEESARGGSAWSSKNPFSSYGSDKSKCEDILFNAHKDFGLPITILRPTYIYGPYDYTGRMGYLFSRVREGKPLCLPKDGNIRMQQVYVEDAAKAFVKCIGNKNAVGESYNICSPECITFAQLADKIGRTVGIKPKIRYTGMYIPTPRGLPFAYFPFPQWSFCCDVSKSIKGLKLDYTPYEEGLKRTHNWLKKEG